MTIAVPAFDEGRRLPAFIADVARLGEAVAAPACEIIVVDDGGAPEHAEEHRLAVEPRSAG